MNDPGGAREYLVVAIADSLFALRAEDVESAVAPRSVTPLPFVPVYVEGLVSVNDRIVPLIDLRALLLPGGVAAGQRSELVVVETARAPCALRVDRVVATVAVSGMEAAGSDGATAGMGDAPELPSAQLVRQRFTHENQTVLVLDSDILGTLVCADEMTAGRRGLLGRLARDAGSDAVHTDACIVVKCGGEIYGIALAEAVEILDIAPGAPIPGAPVIVEGIALLRGEVLLVLSLARALGRAGNDASRCVVVVEHGNARYGLRVDSVEGILAYASENLRGIDGGADGSGSELAGVIVDSQRAIGLVGMDRLFNASRCRALAPFTPARRLATQIHAEAVRTLLEVEVAGEMLGIPLASVRRIARYSASLELDVNEGARVRGAVNIEGAILPVLDLQDALGLVETRVGEHGAWVVVGVEGQEWAIPVNEARRIVDVPESAVESFSDGAGRLVHAVARVDAQLISLLNIDPLLEAA